MKTVLERFMNSQEAISMYIHMVEEHWSNHTDKVTIIEDESVIYTGILSIVSIIDAMNHM